MRKINSSFKTSFISEAGTALKNNDYFGFVELDEYACYVIADGITDMQESDSAKIAIQNIILRFQENPSLSKQALRSYLKTVNRELLKSSLKDRLKASVMVIVTDYEKIRYASAGNARFRLYREGVLKAKSVDMSLSQDLVEEDEITSNVLSRHEERNNLYTYLGQKSGFNPYVSAKIKLMDSDVIALYTRGIWENLDDAEIDDIFSEVTDDPKATLDDAEDMLLSKQPQNLENYTLAVVFVNKTFKDPNRKRRLKRLLMITGIILVVILIISLIIWYNYSKRQAKIEDMNLRYESTIAYMQDNNFVRAKEECQKALKEAESLKDKDKVEHLKRYLQLIESVIAADDAYRDKKYDDAEEGYLTAKDRARYADNLGEKYILRKLDTTQSTMAVNDLISLGDALAEKGEYEKAEMRYLEAKTLALKIHSTDGKKDAVEALRKLYDDHAKLKEETEKKEKKEISKGISDLIASGDTFVNAGDLGSAEKKYIQAKNLAMKNYDDAGKKEALEALNKIYELQAKETDSLNKETQTRVMAEASAAEILKQADNAFSQADYDGAKIYYTIALDKYTALQNLGQITMISDKLQTIATKKQSIEQKQKEADNFAEEGRRLYKEKEYEKAKQYYLNAKNSYLSLGMTDKAEEINGILNQIDIDAAIMETMPE